VRSSKPWAGPRGALRGRASERQLELHAFVDALPFESAHARELALREHAGARFARHLDEGAARAPGVGA